MISIYIYSNVCYVHIFRDCGVQHFAEILKNMNKNTPGQFVCVTVHKFSRVRKLKMRYKMHW